MKNMIKNIINKKKSGQGDIIASLFVILALVVFFLFFIHAMGDVNTRTSLDQIARRYILSMETSGELTSQDIENIKKECKSIKAVKETFDQGVGSIEVIWNNNEGAKGYGSNITLEIHCTAFTIGFDTSADDSMYGGFFRKVTTYNITKQSTAKY